MDRVAGYRVPARDHDAQQIWSNFGTEDHMRAVMRGSALLIIGVVFGSTSGAAAPLSEIPQDVARYARDIEMVVKRSGPVSLEPVFKEGISAADALTGGELERLDKQTYQKVRGMMVGFTISREEAVIAVPIADFFLKLAAERGTSVDRTFFGTLKKTYPDGAWPTYIQAQTDYGGCTVFGGRTLTDVYGAWIAFQGAHPGRYKETTEKELARVGRALESTCACGGEDGVRGELETFLNTYPTSPLATGIAARLEALRNHTSGIRFNCRVQ